MLRFLVCVFLPKGECEDMDQDVECSTRLSSDQIEKKRSWSGRSLRLVTPSVIMKQHGSIIDCLTSVSSRLSPFRSMPIIHPSLLNFSFLPTSDLEKVRGIPGSPSSGETRYFLTFDEDGLWGYSAFWAEKGLWLSHSPLSCA